jgi:hypothetical protein
MGKEYWIRVSVLKIDVKKNEKLLIEKTFFFYWWFRFFEVREAMGKIQRREGKI